MTLMPPAGNEQGPCQQIPENRIGAALKRWTIATYTSASLTDCIGKMCRL
jgi:hypothetical protein